MKKYTKIIIVLLMFMINFTANSLAMTALKGEEAAKYLGDTKSHILSGKYSYKILARKYRDTMHGRFSDGILFVPDNGKYLFIRRKDGDSVVVLGAPNGREEDPATEEAWRQKIANTLSDDNTIPHVFLDDNQKELAVVYVGKGTQVTSRMNDEHLLELSFLVDGARDLQRS